MCKLKVGPVLQSVQLPPEFMLTQKFRGFIFRLHLGEKAVVVIVDWCLEGP